LFLNSQNCKAHKIKIINASKSHGKHQRCRGFLTHIPQNLAFLSYMVKKRYIAFKVVFYRDL